MPAWRRPARRRAADGHHDRHGHAALARRAVGGRHRGVGSQVHVGVGQHDHVVLGPAQRLHPLAVRGAGLVHVAGDRRGPDEAERATSGWSKQPVDRLLVAVHDVEHAVGKPGLGQAARPAVTAAEGSFSLGLSTKVLPQAMARESIHIGTIAGKLKGVMPATTPSGWRIELTSTPVAAGSEKPPFSSWGMPQANSTISMPAGHLTAGVGQHLAVLGGHQRGHLGSVRVDQLAEAEQDLRCGATTECPPGGERVGCRGHGGVDLGRGGKATSACCCPVAGFQTTPNRPDSPATDLPPIQCSILRMLTPFRSSSRTGRGGGSGRRPWDPGTAPPSITTVPRESTVSTPPSISTPS